MRGYDDLKQILELWEQGESKKSISIITHIPRATVTDCIKRYGTVAQLEAVMRGEATQLPDFSDTNQKRVYARPSFAARPRKYTFDELTEAIATSYSMAEVMRKLDIRAAGGNYATLKQRIIELDLDTSHFTGKLWSKGKQSGHANRHPLEEILVKDSTYSTTSYLRKRLINEGIFAHRCVSCGLDTWLENKIPLEIDHINGDRRDNRLDNLRLLCPNCHALTATYRGKNKGQGAVNGS